MHRKFLSFLVILVLLVVQLSAFQSVPTVKANPSDAFTDGYEAAGEAWDDKWDGNGATDWQQGTSGSGEPAHSPHGGTYDAWATTGDTVIISDDIDLSGVTSAALDFWYYLDDTETADLTLYLFDGTVYDTIVQIGGKTESVWLHYIDSLDSQYFISDFRIRFVTVQTAGENVFVDDVKVSPETTTVYSSASDGYILTEAVSWAGARDAGTGTGKDDTDDIYPNSMATVWSTLAHNYTVTRSFFYFNLSSIPDDATITTATLMLYKDTYGESNVSAQKGTQADTLTLADFDSFSGSEYGHVVWSDIYYNSISFDAQGISDINKTGITKICTREYNHDYLNVDSGGSLYRNGAYYSEYSGTVADPKLVVTWTPAVAKAWNDVSTWTASLVTKTWSSGTSWAANLIARTWSSGTAWTANLQTRIWVDIAKWTTSTTTSTFYITTGGNDGDMYGWNTSYTVAHDVAKYVYDDYDDIIVGQRKYGAYYSVYRTFLKFDTSPIPLGSIITNASLELYGDPLFDYSDDDFIVNLQKWTDDTPLTLDDFNEFDGINYDDGNYNSSGFVKGAYNTITISDFDLITKSGNSLICARSSKDVSSTPPTQNEILRFMTYEEGHTPKLIVTWEVSGINLLTRQYISVASWLFDFGTKIWTDAATWTYNLVTMAWQNISWIFYLGTSIWTDIATWTVNISVMVWNDVATWVFYPLTMMWRDLSWLFYLSPPQWVNVAVWIFSLRSPEWMLVALWNFGLKLGENAEIFVAATFVMAILIGIPLLVLIMSRKRS